MTRIFRITSALAIAAMALTACGTPNATGVAPLVSSPAGSREAASLKFVLIVPDARTQSSLSRRPAYISPATVKFSVAIDGGTPQWFQISSDPTVCARSVGRTTCTYSIAISVGTHVLAIQTYDASGTLLSENDNVPATINPGNTNVVRAMLNGIVANITLTLDNPNPPCCAAATSNLYVRGLDADNDIIIGTYANGPITVSDGDTSGNTTLSATTFSSNGSATVSWNGAVIPGYSATFSASDGSIQTSVSQQAVFIPHETVHFAYTGAAETFIVPAGLAQINVLAFGGSGGNGAACAGCWPGTGGASSGVSGTLSVVAQQQLNVVVGSMGGNGSAAAGGYPDGGVGGAYGGGGGGGSSSIRSNGVLLVMASGGGGGGEYGNGYGGNGGNGGNPASGGTNGQYLSDGGGAGSAGAGGRGGVGSCSSGADGGMFSGGAGGTSDYSPYWGYCSGGGGGGGGYYGGGGGGAASTCALCDNTGGGGGGGGGLSYVDPSVGAASFNSYGRGDGSVSISW